MKLLFSELTGMVYSSTKKPIINFKDIIVMYLLFHKEMKHGGYVVKIEKIGE